MSAEHKQTAKPHPRFTEHPETVEGNVSGEFMTLVLKVHPDQSYSSVQAALMYRYAYDLGRKEGKANVG